MDGRTNWIAAELAHAETRLVYFRRVFDALPAQTVLRISADTRYKLYVNGNLVQLGPCKGDDKVWFVDTVELSPYLRAGRNVLAAELLCVGNDAWNSNHSLFSSGICGLYLDGVETEGWRWHLNDAVRFLAEEEGFAPMHIHESAGQDLMTVGWLEPDFDDSAWEKATALTRDQLPAHLLQENLRPRPIPFMEREYGAFDLPETHIPASSERCFLLDAGEETCAFLRLAFSGGRGAEITLLQSEGYVIPTESGDRKQNRTDSENGVLRGYTDSYTVGGQGEEIYAPFWFRTFRYLRLTIRTKDEPLTLLSFTYEKTGYPLSVGTSVTTSDPTLASVWDISLRTLRRCMHETYMDCPFYEQLQYIMDTRSEILYTYAVSADDRLARQAIDDFSRAQRPDGLLNCSYPNKNTNVIPGFSIYYILMLHDHMMYFGDRVFLRPYLGTVKRILNYFDAHRTASGLVDKVGGVNGIAPCWSFIDWAELWMPTQGMPTAGLSGPLTMESLLCILGLQAATELAQWLGEPETAEEYRRRAADMQAAVRRYCMRPDGLLADGPGRDELSQHAQVFGVLTGTLSRKEGRRNLLRTIGNKSAAQCTVAMCFYLFLALEKTGLYETTDRYWDIWRRMVANGCTTCTESEEYARSECHAWGALALYELPTVVLGVRPSAPGYEKIKIRPVPGVLTGASGTVHTPKGDITVRWERQENGIQVRYDCSEELRARIVSEMNA